MAGFMRVVEKDDFAGCYLLAEAQGREVEAVVLELTALPDEVRTVVWVEEGRGVASVSKVEAAGFDGIPFRAIRFQVRADHSPEDGLPLLLAMEEEGRGRGLKNLQVALREGQTSLRPLLEGRGYRCLGGVVTLRHWGPPHPVPPLPAGFHELALDQVFTVDFLTASNDGFEGIPSAGPFTLSHWERFLTLSYVHPSLIRAVADEHGIVATLIGVRGKEEGRGVVDNISVVRRARGLGLGRWILFRCEELLRQDGAREVELSCDSRNTPAWTMYHRNGYEEVNRREIWEIVL